MDKSVRDLVTEVNVIYIHRQRREWDAKDEEMVAYRLVDMMGGASAANILGITVRELDNLVETFDLSEKLTNLREPGASITWAVGLTGDLDELTQALRRYPWTELTASPVRTSPRS